MASMAWWNFFRPMMLQFPSSKVLSERSSKLLDNGRRTLAERFAISSICVQSSQGATIRSAAERVAVVAGHSGDPGPIRFGGRQHFSGQWVDCGDRQRVRVETPQA